MRTIRPSRAYIASNAIERCRTLSFTFAIMPGITQPVGARKPSPLAILPRGAWQARGRRRAPVAWIKCTGSTRGAGFKGRANRTIAARWARDRRARASCTSEPRGARLAAARARRRRKRSSSAGRGFCASSLTIAACRADIPSDTVSRCGTLCRQCAKVAGSALPNGSLQANGVAVRSRRAPCAFPGSFQPGASRKCPNGARRRI